MKRSVAELHYPLCGAQAREQGDGGEESSKNDIS